MLLPSLLGAQLAGDIFKVTAVILFVSELTLVHFSIYSHRYISMSYRGIELFALHRRNIFFLLILSILVCAAIIFLSLSNYISNSLTLFTILLLCIIHALGRVMIVIVDEAYYIVFGDALPLIFASIVCILLSAKDVELFFFCKSLASIPYIIWCTWLLLKNKTSVQTDLMENWPKSYFKNFFLPVSISALSLPFLNAFIFSLLSSLDSVQLRLAQALTGPITVVVANAKSAYLSSKNKYSAVRFGFFFGVLYLIVISPIFLVTVLSGPLDLFGLHFNSEIISGFYIMAIPAFFTLKYIEDIVYSAYSLSRTRLAVYQFIIATILSLVALKLNLSALNASCIFATHTLITIFFIRKASR